MDELSAASGRYTAKTPAGRARAGGTEHGRTYLGEDAKLRRRVLLHEFDAPEDAEREHWLELAKRATRLHYAGYLQVLDVVPSSDQLTIVLEAPFEMANEVQSGAPRDLPALVAIALTLQVGAALEDALKHDLAATQISHDALYLDGSDEVRIDPVALFADADGKVVAGTGSNAVPVLCDFLQSLLEDKTPSARAFDPGARSAASLLVRWRERPAANPESELHAFLAELRGIPAAAANQTSAPSPNVSGDGTGGGRTPSSPDEPTLELPLGAAGRSTQQRTPHEGDQWLATSVSEGMTPTGLAHAEQRRAGRSGAGQGRRRQSGVVVAALLGMTLVAGALVVYAMQASNRTEPPVDTAGAVSTPAPKAPLNRASLIVTAQQSAQVRVTVDGANVFNGVMQPNESRSWDGAQRVQLWTNNGKNMLVTVNGYPLGPLSAAVGHPDWNTVDWGWSTGWAPGQTALDTAPAPSQPIDAQPRNGKGKGRDD